MYFSPGRRKPHTLSLGLPEDPESEGLPFLAMEWDSQFPSTPAQENGQSPDNNNFLKGKDDGEDEKEDRLGSENFNGQSASHHSCYSLENDKEAGKLSLIAVTRLVFRDLTCCKVFFYSMVKEDLSLMGSQIC